MEVGQVFFLFRNTKLYFALPAIWQHSPGSLEVSFEVIFILLFGDEIIRVALIWVVIYREMMVYAFVECCRDEFGFLVRELAFVHVEGGQLPGLEYDRYILFVPSFSHLLHHQSTS